MTAIEVSSEAVARHYRALESIGMLGETPECGYLRAGYSPEETAAMKYVQQTAEEAGLRTAFDPVGNLCVETPGSFTRWIECGSHLDTVPLGGNYDGAAGVVAGLQALLLIHRSGAKLQRGLRLRVWRCEESATFNALYAGSMGAFGKANPKHLENKFRGITLADAMRSQGADPAFVMQGIPTIGVEEISAIDAHIELHIEQGNLLEAENLDIGIVTGIRGPYRTRVVLHGEFDHSGATPMGLKYRKDANLALGYILVELDHLMQTHLAAGADIVQTVGVINSQKDFNELHTGVYQNAVPKVSGYAYFCLDVRSIDSDFLAAYREQADKLIVDTASRFNVRAEFLPISYEGGLKQLDAAIQSETERWCQALGLSCTRMASGAGHDAAVVAKQSRKDGSKVPVGMIFIPCRAGKSHCPEEFTSLEAMAKGASALASTLAALSGAAGK